MRTAARHQTFLAYWLAVSVALSLSEQAERDGLETLSANGRPVGDAEFIARAERKLGRSLRRGRPGPKPRTAPS
jgi:hypothetical protein